MLKANMGQMISLMICLLATTVCLTNQFEACKRKWVWNLSRWSFLPTSGCQTLSLAGTGFSYAQRECPSRCTLLFSLLHICLHKYMSLSFTTTYRWCAKISVPSTKTTFALVKISDFTEYTPACNLFLNKSKSKSKSKSVIWELLQKQKLYKTYAYVHVLYHC